MLPVLELPPKSPSSSKKCDPLRLSTRSTVTSRSFVMSSTPQDDSSIASDISLRQRTPCTDVNVPIGSRTHQVEYNSSRYKDNLLRLIIDCSTCTSRASSASSCARTTSNKGQAARPINIVLTRILFVGARHKSKAASIIYQTVQWLASLC
jgi:hypothetical protein